MVLFHKVKLSAFKMAKCAQTAGASVSRFNEHTVPVIFQINELVIPLCHDTQGVFEESDDDEEATDHGKVSELFMSGQQRVLSSSLSGISPGALCSCPMFREDGHTVSEGRRWYPASPRSCWSVHVFDPADWGRWLHLRDRDRRSDCLGHRDCSRPCHGCEPSLVLLMRVGQSKGEYYSRD